MRFGVMVGAQYSRDRICKTYGPAAIAHIKTSVALGTFASARGLSKCVFGDLFVQRDEQRPDADGLVFHAANLRYGATLVKCIIPKFKR